jgi:hypothetical protein
MAIGEASTAFFFIFIGIVCQLPYMLNIIIFILNGLPKMKVTTDFFCFLNGAGVLSACITGIGASIALVAGAEAATASSIYICVFTFLVLRVFAQSLMPIAVHRLLQKAPKPNQDVSLLIPVLSTRSILFVVSSLLFHIVEFILVAFLTPRFANLVNFTPLYLYIPELVVHLAMTAAVLYYMYGKKPRV